ncbi:MFS transporter [Pseudomonas fluvialis]|uniref:MFS transporter n=1 Tax=Pseudomonas fluvialis TaxID=1793966 RepID=A0A2I0CTQ8_9PSED|nr:MFS transporter [Pseudomonas pharmacofabricae]PKF72715.1 MFS transporter [Pseudomonas pharmacofabricae]
MDALLILAGLMLMLLGLIWLIRMAFSTSLFWGLGSLLPPITLIYLLRYWRQARKAVLLGALGIIPLIVGVTLLASQDAERLQAILSLQWLEAEQQAPGSLDIRLNGELNGQPFRPQHAELIDGVLSLREGGDFFARREVQIRLDGQPGPQLKLSLLPDDPAPRPLVEISWLLPEQDLPEARMLQRGYTLHLDLQAQTPNRYVGDFHLVLPRSLATNLSGRIELYSDRLRYRDGRVDLSHDSEDTLAYVLRDYLQRRFATRAVSLADLNVSDFSAGKLDLPVTALVDGQSQQLQVQLSKQTRGWQVLDDHYPALPAAQVTPTAPAAAQLQVAPRAQRSVDRRLRFTLQRLLLNPNHYHNLQVRAQTLTGRQAQGRFDGVNTRGEVVIRHTLSGTDEATFQLRPEDIRSIELLEP